MGKWILDSGATVSVTNELKLLTNIEDCVPIKYIRLANGQVISIEKRGTVSIKGVKSRGGITKIEINNVYYSSNFSNNLLSIYQLYNQLNITTIFKNDCFLQFMDGSSVKVSRNRLGQYELFNID